MGKSVKFMCHCKYLEPSFWHDEGVCVMHNPIDADDIADFEQWVASKLELRSHVLFQTSGSSGLAKWVALSKSALLASARMVNAHLGVQTGDRWGLALPIYHVGGFGVLVRSFLNGGHCQVFHGKWDAVAFSKFIYDEACNHLSLVPTQLVDLVNLRCVAPPCVKSVVIGGGKLDDTIYHEAKALGWPVLRSYGMTESASQIATGDKGDGWLDILVGWKVRLSSDSLVEWSGEAAFSGYIYETSEGHWKFDNPKTNGWFWTQDLAELKNGRLKILGRADNRVKVLGELINLQELEERLRKQSGCDCVIFTVPDQRRGVRFLPVIESNSPVEVSGFEGIHRLENARYVAEFPRSSLRKVQKAKLKDLAKLQ